MSVHAPRKNWWEPKHAGTLRSDFQPLELREIHVCCSCLPNLRYTGVAAWTAQDSIFILIMGVRFHEVRDPKFIPVADIVQAPGRRFSCLLSLKLKTTCDQTEDLRSAAVSVRNHPALQCEEEPQSRNARLERGQILGSFPSDCVNAVDPCLMHMLFSSYWEASSCFCSCSHLVFTWYLEEWQMRLKNSCYSYKCIHMSGHTDMG